ncbi:hypothetical protein Nepgr_022843 [Nepenthes gracilis]|uniref:Uncharacterized protein n=1 Tax=Nepenthes gracilis TaxID=150966 RepID=A0AAD3XYT3_NEPGR|nr:hypothetical protein Nepgr_022843 [Nepenthes gracilis]
MYALEHKDGISIYVAPLDCDGDFQFGYRWDLVLSSAVLVLQSVWGGCSDYALIWFPAGVWDSNSWVGGSVAGLIGLYYALADPFGVFPHFLAEKWIIGGCIIAANGVVDAKACPDAATCLFGSIHIVDLDGWGLDILLLPFCAAELLPYGKSTVTWLQIALGLWSLGAKPLMLLPVIARLAIDADVGGLALGLAL